MRDYLRTFSLCFDFGKTTELQSRSRESGFKPPMSDAHLTICRAVKLNSVNPIKAAVSPGYTVTQMIISRLLVAPLVAYIQRRRKPQANADQLPTFSRRPLP